MSTTSFHDRVTQLTMDVESEIAAAEANLTYLRNLHASINAVIRPTPVLTAFEEATGIPTPKVRSRWDPETKTLVEEPIVKVTNPRLPLGEAMLTILAGTSNGLMFKSLQDRLVNRGYDVKKQGGGGLNAFLAQYLRTGKIRRDSEGRYFFVYR